MALTAYRGSTQDSSAGVQVAVAVNEDAAGQLVAGVQSGNKTTYSETSRTSLTTADAPTGGDLTTGGFAASGLIDLGNALNAEVRATCGTASATITGRLIFYDASGTPLCQGTSQTLSFTSDATLRLGNATGDFVCPKLLVDVGAARKCKFFLDSVSSGTWAVYVRPV